MGVSSLTWWVTIARSWRPFGVRPVAQLSRNPRVPRSPDGSPSAGLHRALPFFPGSSSGAPGAGYAGEYYAGWLTVLPLGRLTSSSSSSSCSASRCQSSSSRALLAGIVIAIVLRGIFIAAGAAAIERFSWVFCLFRGISRLHRGQARQGRESDDEVSREPAAPVGGPASTSSRTRFVGTRLVAQIDGVRQLTAMALVILSLGTTDYCSSPGLHPGDLRADQGAYLVPHRERLRALGSCNGIYFPHRRGCSRSWCTSASGSRSCWPSSASSSSSMPCTRTTCRSSTAVGPLLCPEIPIAVSLGAIVAILEVATAASLWKSRRDARSA